MLHKIVNKWNNKGTQMTHEVFTTLQLNRTEGSRIFFHRRIFDTRFELTFHVSYSSPFIYNFFPCPFLTSWPLLNKYLSVKPSSFLTTYFCLEFIFSFQSSAFFLQVWVLRFSSHYVYRVCLRVQVSTSALNFCFEQDDH